MDTQELLQAGNKYGEGSILKGYWFGKAVQKWNNQIPHDESFPLEQLIEDIKKSKSFLTAETGLLLSLNDETTISTENCINENGLLIWEQFSKLALLGSIENDKSVSAPVVKEQVSESDENDVYDEEEQRRFKIAAANIRSKVHQVHKFVASLTKDQIVSMFSSCIPHVIYEKDFSSLWELSQRDQQGSMLCCNIICTYLERFLGDIYVSVAKVLRPSDDIKVPRLLRELLVAPELEQAFGPDVIFLLRLLIGPPTGFNTRNILWHGFVTLTEFPPAITSFLMVVLMNLCHKFQTEKKEMQLVKRPQNNLAQFQEKAYDFGLGSYIMNDLRKEEFPIIREILDHSYFVIPKRHDLVMQAFGYFLETPTPSTHYPHRLMCTILPILEHCLRRIYVAVNDMNDCRTQAVAHQYYTTLDLFLDKHVESDLPSDLMDSTPKNYNDAPDSKEPPKILNKLGSEIGNQSLDVLYDMFVHTGGPRVRDKVSHGEALVDSICPIHSDRILGFFLYMTLRYTIASQDKLKGWMDSLPWLPRCINFFDNYRSCFHPKVMVFKDLLKARDTHWNTFCNLVSNSFVEEESQVKDVVHFLSEEDKNITTEDHHWIFLKRNEWAQQESHVIHMWHGILQAASKPGTRLLFDRETPADYFNDGSFSTVFCSATEMTKIVTLSQQVQLLQVVLDALSSKINTLRSEVVKGKATKRLQDSFYKLIASLGYFSEMMWVFLVLTEALLRASDSNGVLKLSTSSLGCLQRIQMKIQDNQWLVVHENFQKYAKELSKFYKLDTIKLVP